MRAARCHPSLLRRTVDAQQQPKREAIHELFTIRKNGEKEMKEIKRRSRGVIVAAYAAAFLAMGLALTMPKPVSASGDDEGHLLWDARDQKWRCVGSPLDCEF